MTLSQVFGILWVCMSHRRTWSSYEHQANSEQLRVLAVCQWGYQELVFLFSHLEGAWPVLWMWGQKGCWCSQRKLHFVLSLSLSVQVGSISAEMVAWLVPPTTPTISLEKMIIQPYPWFSLEYPLYQFLQYEKPEFSKFSSSGFIFHNISFFSLPLSSHILLWAVRKNQVVTLTLCLKNLG